MTQEAIVSVLIPVKSIRNNVETTEMVLTPIPTKVLLSSLAEKLDADWEIEDSDFKAALGL